MSTASTPSSAPKMMSSRLLTMKFMQRAANSSPASLSPSPLDEPSPKRRKTDSSSSTPSKTNAAAFNANALADRSAVQDALAKEEEKRQALLQRQAEQLGDTRWVLSFEEQKNLAAASALPLRVVPTNFANLDASPRKIQYMEDDSDEKPKMVGRRSFGNFNKVVEKQQNPAADESSSSGSDSDSSESDESDEEDPTSELIASARRDAADKLKAERKAKKRAAKAEAGETARKRRKKEINLNGLTSLSGKPERQPVVPPNLKCHNCQGNHFQKDCPTARKHKKRSHQGGDEGPPRKMKKAK